MINSSCVNVQGYFVLNCALTEFLETGVVKKSSGLRYWLIKIVKYLIIIEVVYVVLINALFQIPLTQSVINKIRPEKFYIRWENAWSIIPGRVHVSNAMANGDSRGQMWQVEVGEVSGSIALIPLIAKRVWVDNVSGENIEFRLRPRIKEDKDYSRIEAYFPEIEGREVTPAVTTPRKKKRPWHISVEDIHVSGPLDYWIFNIKGQAEGDLRGDFSYVSPGGNLVLDVFELGLDLGPHFINGDQEMFPAGQITGSMGFAPFNPRENKGLPMLNYLLVDADVNIDMNSLKFVKLFLLNFQGLDVDGTGQVSGRLHFEEGRVMEGTDLAIDARDLTVDVLAHSIRGRGEIDLTMGPETDGNMDLLFHYSDLEVIHEGDDVPMLTGEDLELRIGGDGRVVPDPDTVNKSRVIGFEIDALKVPDLALFQRYLPEKWPFSLYGGDGTLSGAISLTPTAYSIDLALASEAADMGISQYRFESDLDAELKLDNESIMTTPTHVEGSYITLSKAHLMKEGEKSEESWSASLMLKEGEFHLLGKDDRAVSDDVVDLFRILGNSEAKSLLAESGGRFNFEAEVSSLAWISAFLGAEYNSDFHGSSTVGGTLALVSGLPAPGTDVAIKSSELVVNFLDYVSRGIGQISLKVEEGGEAPDWRLNLDLSEAELRRRSDEKAYVQDVEMRFDALVENVNFNREEKKDFDMTLAIDSARVTDMSVFNRYLPPDSPMAFSGGEAQLGADIQLKQDDADGWLKLQSDDVELDADDQSLLADLVADITLVGGVPADMKFDITGSKIVLDNVRVDGENADFEEDAWRAELELLRGETVFTKPMELDIEAGLKISDSRPIVAMFKNQEGWRPEFLARMMTLEDIEGTGEMKMANEQIVIPFTHLTSDNAEAGMKAVISGEHSDGVIFFRYKKFNGLLKIKDGKRNFDIINARKKYEKYVPPAR